MDYEVYGSDPADAHYALLEFYHSYCMFQFNRVASCWGSSVCRTAAHLSEIPDVCAARFTGHCHRSRGTRWLRMPVGLAAGAPAAGGAAAGASPAGGAAAGASPAGGAAAGASPAGARQRARLQLRHILPAGQNDKGG